MHARLFSLCAETMEMQLELREKIPGHYVSQAGISAL
jgi:hypothetical protein